jgi:DNA-binding CsgD family transcriptional regulator
VAAQAWSLLKMAVGRGGMPIIIKLPPTCCPRRYGKSKRETPFFSLSLAKQPGEHYQKSPDRVGLLKKKGARLTSREVEVLQLIAEGKANQETPAELGIGIKTAEKHREHLMRKLDTHDTAGLTRYAISAGIIESSIQLTII